MVISINTEQLKRFSTSTFTEIHLEALRGCRINRQYSPLCACPFYALSETNPQTHKNRKLIHFRHPSVSVLFLWMQCIANRVLVPSANAYVHKGYVLEQGYPNFLRPWSLRGHVVALGGLSLQLLPKTFLILKTFQRDIITNDIRST